jgi:hypothetical protein
MVCSSCYWKPELKDCKSDNSLSLTEMIGTTAKELPSKRALELSELKLITMFKTVSTLERGLGVERAKTPFFRGLPRRPTKLDDIHGAVSTAFTHTSQNSTVLQREDVRISSFRRMLRDGNLACPDLET